MTAEENDSLAELNIDPAWIDVWRRQRHLYDYDLAPDHRAELFAEQTYAAAYPDDAAAEAWAERQRRADLEDWSAREREHYSAEAVPF